eukprot:TRINITY_DN1659_c0_g2_i5.p1 TRINITY_DN1659_c0_g2~~TRINITY_DN1659_c0_g2_i5.p1  ORF type:complete len:291 (-),score=33.81 TRINITY_DN1659_c0_g2_i5:92-904(-)
MSSPVCLVMGAGFGLGSGIARRFAREGYTVCLVRRRDKTKLEALAAELKNLGHKAIPYLCDGANEDSVRELVEGIEREVGPIEVAICNLGAQVGDRPIQKLKTEVFTLAWQLGSLSAFLLGKTVSKFMVERGRGTLLFTGATAGMRGNSGQAAHSAAMMGRRAVAQSLAHELGPLGIHVAHIVIDGLVDSPDTLGKFAPELFQALRKVKAPQEGIVLPDQVSETYWHVHSQPRCAWTFELDVRPWTDTAWFHTGRNEDALKIDLSPKAKL